MKLLKGKLMELVFVAFSPAVDVVPGSFGERKPPGGPLSRGWPCTLGAAGQHEECAADKGRGKVGCFGNCYSPLLHVVCS